MKKLKIRLKRVYLPSETDDGTRILVERLWPRGASKADAAIDLWLKEIAPSHSLRRWYGHDISKWPMFVERYQAELNTNQECVGGLRRAIASAAVTFVYAASDETHNSAVALRNYLLGGH